MKIETRRVSSDTRPKGGFHTRSVFHAAGISHAKRISLLQFIGTINCNFKMGTAPETVRCLFSYSLTDGVPASVASSVGASVSGAVSSGSGTSST